MGAESRIQLNDKFAEVSEVQDYITQERLNLKEEDQPFMTVSLKVDKDTRMGIVTLSLIHISNFPSSRRNA